MRALHLLVGLWLIGFPLMACGEPPPFNAGIARLSVAPDAPLETLIWYPTRADKVAWQAGPFLLRATHNAAAAQGRFPVVLLSHGGGLGGGTPLMLSDLSAALARNGFVVVAPFHRKTGRQGRTLQIKQALEDVVADPRFASHVDRMQLGMLGFSLGTAVTLELAGAMPNLAHLVAYCAAHPRDAMSCDHAPDGRNLPPPGAPASAMEMQAPAPLPLKAIVLLDPFAVLFQRPELVAVTMPVLIFRPTCSELPGEANAIGLAAALPHPPGFQTIPGSHFVFTDTCPESLAATSPEACQDPSGVDRAAVHAAIEVQIVDFFRKHL